MECTLHCHHAQDLYNIVKGSIGNIKIVVHIENAWVYESKTALRITELK